MFYYAQKLLPALHKKTAQAIRRFAARTDNVIFEVTSWMVQGVLS